VLAVLALATSALLGLAWGSHAITAGSTGRSTGHAMPAGMASTAAPGTPRTVEPDQRRWLPILADLDGVRAQAYEHGDPALLSRVYLPGRHLRADSARLAALVSVGDTARGVRHRLTRIDVLAASNDHVRLRVLQSLRPSQRLHAGQVVGVIPGAAETAILVDLVGTPAGWRLA
jgi:hypothetical protein